LRDRTGFVEASAALLEIAGFSAESPTAPTILLGLPRFVSTLFWFLLATFTILQNASTY
jgi:hypothetical protein